MWNGSIVLYVFTTSFSEVHHSLGKHITTVIWQMMKQILCFPQVNGKHTEDQELDPKVNSMLGAVLTYWEFEEDHTLRLGLPLLIRLLLFESLIICTHCLYFFSALLSLAFSISQMRKTFILHQRKRASPDRNLMRQLPWKPGNCSLFSSFWRLQKRPVEEAQFFSLLTTRNLSSNLTKQRWWGHYQGCIHNGVKNKNTECICGKCSCKSKQILIHKTYS